MQTVTIHTTQNIGIDYEVAGLGDRILARLIDFGVFLGFWFIAIFISVLIAHTSEYLRIGIMIAIFAIFGFYDLICEMFFNGQSVGKRVMKIRVISLDGGRPTFSQYLIRWVFRIVDFGITFQLGALISALVTKNIQRIGDVVANTTLIRTKPRTQMEHLVFTPSENTYVPVFSEVIQLNDRDVTLISEVISSYYKTANTVIVYNMAEKVKTHLGITPPKEMNDLNFLQTIIKDYSHMAAQTAM